MVRTPRRLKDGTWWFETPPIGSLSFGRQVSAVDVARHLGYP
jgi:hypothetical protein